MWENRISEHFEALFGPTSPPTAQAQAIAGPKPGCPHLVHWGDIYQAARARAVLDQQLGKLFNPDAPVE